MHPTCCLSRSALSSKLSSRLLVFFHSPVLIPLLWLGSTARLRGANWGRLCACQAAPTPRIYWRYGMWVNSCSWSKDRHCFPSPLSAADPPSPTPWLYFQALPRLGMLDVASP